MELTFSFAANIEDFKQPMNQESDQSPEDKATSKRKREVSPSHGTKRAPVAPVPHTSNSRPSKRKRIPDQAHEKGSRKVDGERSVVENGTVEARVPEQPTKSKLQSPEKREAKQSSELQHKMRDPAKTATSTSERLTTPKLRPPSSTKEPAKANSRASSALPDRTSTSQNKQKPSRAESAAKKERLTGFFTSEEVQKLENFKLNFCNTHGLSADNFDRMVQHSDRDKGVEFPCDSDIITKPEFWKTIYDTIPMRDQRSVYRFMRRHFQASTQKPHQWSHEQDDELVSMHARYGPKWAYIAKLLGRSDDDVVQRWKNRLEHRATMLRGPWSAHEIRSLQDALQATWKANKKAGYNPGKDIYEMDETLIGWGQVSDRMQHVRSRQQCADKWRRIRRKVLDTRNRGNPEATYEPTAELRSPKKQKQPKSPAVPPAAKAKENSKYKSAEYVNSDEDDDADGQVAQSAVPSPSKESPFKRPSVTEMFVKKEVNDSPEKSKPSPKAAPKPAPKSEPESESESGSETDSGSESDSDNDNGAKQPATNKAQAPRKTSPKESLKSTKAPASKSKLPERPTSSPNKKALTSQKRTRPPTPDSESESERSARKRKSPAPRSTKAPTKDQDKNKSGGSQDQESSASESSGSSESESESSSDSKSDSSSDSETEDNQKKTTTQTTTKQATAKPSPPSKNPQPAVTKKNIPSRTENKPTNKDTSDTADTSDEDEESSGDEDDDENKINTKASPKPENPTSQTRERQPPAKKVVSEPESNASSGSSSESEDSSSEAESGSESEESGSDDESESEEATNRNKSSTEPRPTATAKANSAKPKTQPQQRTSQPPPPPPSSSSKPKPTTATSSQNKPKSAATPQNKQESESEESESESESDTGSGSEADSGSEESESEEEEEEEQEPDPKLRATANTITNKNKKQNRPQAKKETNEEESDSHETGSDSSESSEVEDDDK